MTPSEHWKIGNINKDIVLSSTKISYYLPCIRRKHRTSRMEKNPSILRFGSLSVKVITWFSKQEASSYALLARWRRPRKHSTTTLATGASTRGSGKTTMETRRRCRPLDLHRYLKVDTLLSFCTCKFCQPFSCWKSVPLNVFRLRNEVIPNARLTLVERSLPLSPQLREALSRRCVQYFDTILSSFQF